MTFWANFYMTKWDLFLNSHKDFHFEIDKNNMNPPFFRKENEISYKLFRTVFQIIDCSLLDTNTLFFNQRGIVMSTFYLILGLYYNLWTIETLKKQEFLSNILDNQEFLIFNQNYNKFLKLIMGIELAELLPYINYLSNFFKLEFNYQIPSKSFEVEYFF